MTLSNVFRLAVKKDSILLPENVTIASYIPIEEWKRCHFVRYCTQFIV